VGAGIALEHVDASAQQSGEIDAGSFCQMLQHFQLIIVDPAGDDEFFGAVNGFSHDGDSFAYGTENNIASKFSSIRNAKGLPTSARSPRKTDIVWNFNHFLLHG
jgi:hypothetical protein